MTKTKLVIIERSGDVAHVVLNRPNNANALNTPLLLALKSALDDALNSGARAVVLAGAGRGFSAGADFSELTGTAVDLAVDDRIGAVTATIVNAPVPVVAALHGFCFGGSVDIAWSCDIVVATPTTRIAVPATRLGILYNPIALQRLHARLGSLALRQLFLFGDELSGERAWQLGAVTHLSETDDAREFADKLARQAGRGLLAAVDTTKQFLNELDAGAANIESWQARRYALQASAERLAIIKARQK